MKVTTLLVVFSLLAASAVSANPYTINDVMEKLIEIDKRLVRVETKVDMLDKRMDSLDKRMDRLDKRVDAANTLTLTLFSILSILFGGILAFVFSLSRKMGAVEQSLEMIGEKVGIRREKREAVEIQTLEKRVKHLEELLEQRAMA